MSVGSMCAIPISPWLADWRGRRVAIIIGILIMFVGVALQAASVALGMFIFARFLVYFLLLFFSNTLMEYILTVIYRLDSGFLLLTALLLSWSLSLPICNIALVLHLFTIPPGILVRYV